MGEAEKVVSQKEKTICTKDSKMKAIQGMKEGQCS